jgi:hypothetical protein
MWASASGTLDTVLTLLMYGADVNARTYVRNLMMMMMMVMTLIKLLLPSC